MRRLPATLLFAGIAAFAALYLASIGPYWNISPDSSSYVGWGRSLATGAAWSSQLSHPPLTGLVFAAVLRVFPNGYVALNTLTPLLIFLGLGLAYRTLERRVGRELALLAILLTLAAGRLYQAATQLLSEPLYLACSMAALSLLDDFHPKEERDPPLRLWLAGVLLVATALTRTIGVALGLAVLLVEAVRWFQDRRKPRLVLVGFALVAIASVPLWQAYSGTSYASDWFGLFVLRDPWVPDAGRLSVPELLERLRANLDLLPRMGGLLLNRWGTSHPVVNVLLQAGGTLAVLWGLWLSLRRRLGVAELYVVLYATVIVAHMVLGGDTDYRFFLPVLPLLFGYALLAVRDAAERVARKRAGHGPGLLLAGFAALYLFGYLRIGWNEATRGVVEAHDSPFGSYPIKRPENFDAQRLALWLRDHTRPDDRYAAAQRSMFNVLTERRGDDILIGHTSPADSFLARLTRREVRYLLVDRKRPDLRDALLAVVGAHPTRFRLIRELPGASLYEVLPQGP